jgi:hypothetical protein
MPFKKEHNSRIKDTSVRYVKRGNLEVFKHNFCHPLTVGGYIPGWFGDQDRMLGWVDLDDIVENMRDESGNGLKVRY